MDKVTLEEFKKEYPDLSDQKYSHTEQFDKNIEFYDAFKIFDILNKFK